MAPIALVLTLVLSVALAPAPAWAATLGETLEESVFENEPGSTGRCTVYAAANMLRRAALLNGDPGWDDITTSDIATSGGGLGWSFSVSTGYGSYSVEHAYLVGSTEAERSAELQALLAENPAGIVLYAGDAPNPHAVTLLGCRDGVFYAHDSLTGATSSLGDCVTVRVADATAYWYVSSEVAAPSPDSLESAVVTVGDVVHDGAAAEPEVTVTLGPTTLVEGLDCAVAYAGNDSVGTATATVVGMGDYEGTVVVTFEVMDGGELLATRCETGAAGTAADATSLADATRAFGGVA